MATEIISIAFHFQTFQVISQILFMTGFIAYLLLCFLYGLRLFCHFKEVRNDLLNPKRVFFYFTFIAGTNTLGVRSALAGYEILPIVLCFLALIAIIPFIYFVLISLIFCNRHSLIESLDPSWLLMTVASSSMAIMVSYIVKENSSFASALSLGGFFFWSFGLITYFIILGFIFQKLFFSHLKEISPAYWLCIGAAAITIVAGNSLLDSIPGYFHSIHEMSFIRSVNGILWTFATILLPLLILMEGWKYFVYKEPLQYSPALWSMVFPMGMYTMATYLISLSFESPLIQKAIPYALWTALFFWVWVGIGMLKSFVKESKI